MAVLQGRRGQQQPSARPSQWGRGSAVSQAADLWFYQQGCPWEALKNDWIPWELPPPLGLVASLVGWVVQSFPIP